MHVEASLSRYKTTNWRKYSNSLITRSLLTFGIDEKSRPRLFSDLAITTALTVKRIFSLPLTALQSFMDSDFRLANVPLVCAHYTCIKDVEVSVKTSS